MISNESNRVVGITYTVTESGKDDVIDTNVGSAPLEFVTGKGMIIPGLEKKVAEMKEGESATITVPAKDAYGEFDPEAVQTLPEKKPVLRGIDPLGLEWDLYWVPN